MSNLIPESLRKKIAGEYRARFVLVGSSMAIGGAFFTVLALAPSFSVLYMTRPATLAAASLDKQNKSDSAELVRAHTVATQLTPAATASSTVSDAIASSLENKPGGVHVDHVFFSNKLISTIQIEGTAESRGVIDSYRMTLQGNPNFTSVKLPLGNLVDINGRFTITLTGNF